MARRTSAWVLQIIETRTDSPVEHVTLASTQQDRRTTPAAVVDDKSGATRHSETPMTGSARTEKTHWHNCSWSEGRQYGTVCRNDARGALFCLDRTRLGSHSGATVRAKVAPR